MIKLIKFIFYVALLCISFFFGVKYSQQTREMADWLFEAKEKEIDIQEIKEDIKNNYDDGSLNGNDTIEESIDPEPITSIEDIQGAEDIQGVEDIQAIESVKPEVNTGVNRSLENE